VDERRLGLRLAPEADVGAAGLEVLELLQEEISR